MHKVFEIAALLPLLAAPAFGEPIRLAGRIEPAGARGARVELRAIPRIPADRPAPPPVSAQPAADGTFTLTVPAAGLYRLTAQAEGFLPAEVAPFPVVEETDLPRVWLRPAGEPGEAVRPPAAATPSVIQRGRVLDSVTQTPLPGALVWQAGLNTAKDVPWTWTSADGSFRITLRGPDPVIGVAAAGHVPISRYSPTEPSPTLALQPAATLAGQIVDPEGRPIAGASIDAALRDPSWTGRPDNRETRSGADGRFRLHHLKPEAAYLMAVNAEGFVSAWREATLGAPGPEVPPVQIVLSRGVAVTGRIVDPEGQPVAEADLLLMTAADGPKGSYGAWQHRRASSNASGRFRLDQVGTTDYQLQVTRTGFVPAFRSGTIEAHPEARVELGDLALDPGMVIEGRVTDVHGAPVEGAQVAVPNQVSEKNFLFSPEESVTTLTGPEGAFRIGDLERGRRFDLSVSKPGYVPIRMPGVEAPTAEPLDIELRPARSLSGRVLDTERRPVADAGIWRIELQETGFGDSSSLSRAAFRLSTTDAEGRFLASDLEPGFLRLEIKAPGLRTAEISRLRISEDEDPAPLEIVLEAGPILEGRVLDGKGQPLGRALIRISLPDASSFRSPMIMTDEDGRYRVDGLEPGEHRVEGEILTSRRRAVGKVVLGDSGTHHLDLRLPSGARVSGRVTGEQGEPLRGARLSLQGRLDEPGGPSAISSEDGSFRIEDVPDGIYRLSGSAPGYVPETEPDAVHVEGREVAGLALRLARGGTIRGRILGITDEDASFVRLEARPDGSGPELEAFFGGLAEPDGAYRLPPMPPGAWRVTASLLSGLKTSGVARIAAPGDEVTLDLEMPRGLTLSGRVLVDGRPLSDALIFVTLPPAPDTESGEQPPAGTRYDGSFAIRGLRPGRITLSVVSRGIRHARTLDLVADQEIVIEIATGRLSGAVLSAAGQPIAGVLVALRRQDPESGSWSEAAEVLTDERGAFEVSRLAAGSYRITATGDGFAPASQTLVVTPGGTTEVQVVLRHTMAPP